MNLHYCLQTTVINLKEIDRRIKVNSQEKANLAKQGFSTLPWQWSIRNNHYYLMWFKNSSGAIWKLIVDANPKNNRYQFIVINFFNRYYFNQDVLCQEISSTLKNLILLESNSRLEGSKIYQQCQARIICDRLVGYIFKKNLDLGLGKYHLGIQLYLDNTSKYSKHYTGLPVEGTFEDVINIEELDKKTKIFYNYDCAEKEFCSWVKHNNIEVLRVLRFHGKDSGNNQ